MILWSYECFGTVFFSETNPISMIKKQRNQILPVPI